MSSAAWVHHADHDERRVAQVHLLPDRRLVLEEQRRKFVAQYRHPAPVVHVLLVEPAPAGLRNDVPHLPIHRQDSGHRRVGRLHATSHLRPGDILGRDLVDLRHLMAQEGRIGFGNGDVPAVREAGKCLGRTAAKKDDDPITQPVKTFLRLPLEPDTERQQHHDRHRSPGDAEHGEAVRSFWLRMSAKNSRNTSGDLLGRLLHHQLTLAEPWSTSTLIGARAGLDVPLRPGAVGLLHLHEGRIVPLGDQPLGNQQHCRAGR